MLACTFVATLIISPTFQLFLLLLLRVQHMFAENGLKDDFKYSAILCVISNEEAADLISCGRLILTELLVSAL